MISENSCYIIAEIGINHNGDVSNALKMMQAAQEAGCDAVKFQKRTIEVVYTAEELARPRQSVFGKTNGDLKFGLEFGSDAYNQIDARARDLGIDWFASPWDEGSVDFLMGYADSPYLKIASAMLTDKAFLEHCARSGRPLLLSTGMSDLSMVQRAVAAIHAAGGSIACVYHCTSTYPTRDEEINLSGIGTLQSAFPDLKIGYSGHEVDILPTFAAAAMGAVSVERHITLNRADWGSDQSASIEIPELKAMVGQIRRLRTLQGDGIIRIYEDEMPIAEKLRRNNTL